MTDAQYIAIEIADAYGLDPVRFMRASAFLAAVAEALKAMSADEVVAQVRAEGPLTRLVKPYGGVIARIQRLPEDHVLRQRIVADKVEAARWKAVDKAARRGETLADLVATEQLYADEAEDMLTAEFADEDIRAIALEALRGQQQ
ncbi:MAG: hypothetical protein ACLPYW_17990 [Acidimicrobiales bacterium]